MRILLLTTHLNIGGISTYVISLAKALKGKGHQVAVVSSGGVLIYELSNYGVSHIQMNISTKSEISAKLFKAIFELTKLARSMDIELIHAHTRVSQVIAYFVSRFCKIGFVTTCHGFFERRFSRRVFPCWGDRVIAVSEAVFEHLVKDWGLETSRIDLIYNGVDVKKFLSQTTESEKDRIKEKLGLGKDRFTIGIIARFTPDKGHDVLLYSIQEILKKEPKLQILIVGEGRFKIKIEELSQRLNMDNNVVFLRSQINTAPILDLIDVFVFPPRRKEGLGLALIEAMAAGRPVVATKVGGIISIIQDGVNGLLVEPSNSHRLAEAIYTIIKDKELAKRLAQNARRTVVEKFSLDGMVERIERLYREVGKIYDPKKKIPI